MHNKFIIIRCPCKIHPHRIAVPRVLDKYHYPWCPKLLAFGLRLPHPRFGLVPPHTAQFCCQGPDGNFFFALVTFNCSLSDRISHFSTLSFFHFLMECGSTLYWRATCFTPLAFARTAISIFSFTVKLFWHHLLMLSPLTTPSDVMILIILNCV